MLTPKQRCNKYQRENGYLKTRVLPSGEIAAIAPFLFTAAIVSELDDMGYQRRWCYHSMNTAIKAFNAWDGTGEPDGWHRALVRGEPERKRAKDGRTLTQNEDGDMCYEDGQVEVDY